MNFLLSLLETVADVLFFTWLRRERRGREGRPQRPLQDDIAEGAYFDVVTTTVWGLVGAALFFTLLFGFDLPFGWSFAIAVIPVGLHLGRRLIHLLRD